MIEDSKIGTRKASTDDSNGTEDSSSHWRSTGWCPLAYPASSLFRCQSLNPHFPLHGDVLLAAIRELLIIEGVIDGLSLSVNTASLPGELLIIDGIIDEFKLSTNKSSFLPSKLTANRIVRYTTDKSENAQRKKRKLGHEVVTQSNVVNEKVVSPIQTDEPTEILSADTSSADKAEETKHPLAEDIANFVLKKSCILPEPESTSTPTKCDTSGDLSNNLAKRQTNRPPRKVSDADESANKCRDLLLYLDLSSRAPNGSYRLLRADLPPLLEVSIVSESVLRDASIEICDRAVRYFSDKTLRIFLGYKSSSMKRDHLIEMISECLFNVSHAMFAWDETERDLLLDFKRPPKSFLQIDANIRDSLFDDRALAKIGGFDHSSLLPQALSISRTRKRNLCWKTFAKTEQGRRMLRHHCDGNYLQVGQKRRGQRSRPRSSTKRTAVSSDEEGTRSRSSSIASRETVESEFLDDSMPTTTHFTINRVAGKPWGILLAKEGNMCVVVRGPCLQNATSSTEKQDKTSSRLCCGDMILSVRNECGESVCPPPSRLQDGVDVPKHWFRDITQLFKTSSTLHLEIRRIGFTETSL